MADLLAVAKVLMLVAAKVLMMVVVMVDCIFRNKNRSTSSVSNEV